MEGSVCSSDLLAEIEDERHPSFYKPGSGNILSFFAETASGPAADFSDVQVSFDFVNKESASPGVSAPDTEASPPSALTPQASDAESGASGEHVGSEEISHTSQAGRQSGSPSSEPVFRFQSHAGAEPSDDREAHAAPGRRRGVRSSLTGDTASTKNRRQLLSDYQQQKKRQNKAPAQSRRQSTAGSRPAALRPLTSSSANSGAARRQGQVQVQQLTFSRRQGEFGRAAKVARGDKAGAGCSSENDKENAGVGGKAQQHIAQWVKQQQAATALAKQQQQEEPAQGQAQDQSQGTEAEGAKGTGTMFNMHFSPPSKQQQNKTVVHVRASGAPRDEGANGGGGRGGMFTMMFSPPSKPGQRNRNKRTAAEPEDGEGPAEAGPPMGPPEAGVACVTTQLSSLSLSPAQATAAGGSADHASLAADFLQEGTPGGDENADPNPRLALNEAPESAVEERGQQQSPQDGDSNQSGSVLNSPFGGMIPPYASPSKLQLLDTLDELIQKEKDLKALADQLLKTEEDAVRWEEAAVAAQEQVKGLTEDLETANSTLSQREAECAKLRHQLEVTLQKMAELELQATQAKVGGAASLNEAQLSLLNASQERLLELEKFLMQVQTRADEDRKRLEEELAHERSSQRVLEELLEPMLRSLGTHMSVRDVIAQQGGREEVWRALQAVVQEGQQAKQHVEAQGKVVEDLEAKLASLHGLQASVQDKDQDLQRYQAEMEQLRAQAAADREASARQLQEAQEEAQAQLEQMCVQWQREGEEREEGWQAKVRHAEQDAARAVRDVEQRVEQMREEWREEVAAKEEEWQDRVRQAEGMLGRREREVEDRMREEARRRVEDAERAGKERTEKALAALRATIAGEKADVEARAMRRARELEEELSDLQSSREEALARLEESEARCQQLQREVEEGHSRLGGAKEKAAALEKRLQGETAQLRQDVKTLREDLTRHKESERGVEEQRRRMVDIMRGLEEQLRVATKDLHDERDVRRTLEEHVQHQQKDMSELQAENSVLKCKVDEYRAQARHLEELHAQLGVRMGRLEDDCEKKDQMRKTLHNQVMELKGNIRVFVRVRPPLSGESAVLPFEFVDSGVGTSISGEPDCHAIEVTEPQAYRGGLSEKRRRWRFSYDQVFGPRASQEAVFAEVSPLVQSALDGYRACIFAYGQTGSGKTYTMMGAESDPAGPCRGVVYRAVEQIFTSIHALAQHGWTFRLSMEMVEIYNESIRDLLSAVDHREALASSTGSNGSTSSSHKGLEVRQWAGREGEDDQAIPGLTSVDVSSACEVSSLLSRAMGRRCTKSTRINADSSRSHCLLTLRIHGQHATRHMTRKGCLHLVDLAGSERLSKSGSAEDPALLKEAQAINKSLSVLGNVISALYRRERHVPFRESTLTRLLRPSLGGDSKALMFCNLAPTPVHLHESMCSLRFAQKVNACTTSTANGQANGPSPHGTALPSAPVN